MLLDQKETFFTDNATSITCPPDNAIHPFHQHAALQLLTDTLSRKHKHHLLLSTQFDSFTLQLFLESLLSFYQHQHRDEHIQMHLLSLDNALVTDIKQLSLEKEFAHLRETLTATKQTLLLVLKHPDIFSRDNKKSDERFLRRQLDTLISHPNCRLLILTNPREQLHYQHLNDTFALIDISDCSEAENITVLKRQCQDLETYHHVVIPDELLILALKLSHRYLQASHPLEKTLLLLDSSAARLKATEHSTLTTTTLLTVLSDWTHIPITQLEPSSFNLYDFTQHMQQSLFGQESAIALLGQTLTHNFARHTSTNGPLANFLFIGTEHAGKKTAARALSDFLFKTHTVFLIASDISHATLSALKAKRQHDPKLYRLTDLIQQTPYAIIVFEHAEKLSPALLETLLEVTNTGIYQDANGDDYDFSQAILILNTVIDKSALENFVDTYSADEDVYTMDLMQLVMSDQKQINAKEKPTYSTQDIIETMLPEIAHRFPEALLQRLHVIPFLPLNKDSIEKILRHQLKVLGKDLAEKHAIEFGYAPEVIRYLIKLDDTSPNRALKELRFCMDQALLSFHDSKNSSNQLFLQLNETGHALRFDWLALAAVSRG